MEFIGVAGKEKSQLPPVLILPALSIGNVGQLATDLLISTRTVTKAGYLDDPYVLPCIGNDPFVPGGGMLAVALEVYEDSKSGLAILQQRSPVVKGKMVEYAEHFADWAKSTGFEEIIILSGLDSSKCGMRGMAGPQIHYISSASSNGSDELCNTLGWKRLDQVDQQIQNLAIHSESEVTLTDDTYYAGLPFALLYSSCKERGLKVVSILSFCSEGDNIPDAFFVAESLDHLLKLKQSSNPGNVQWRIPLSWTTVYGPPPDDSIF